MLRRLLAQMQRLLATPQQQALRPRPRAPLEEALRVSVTDGGKNRIFPLCVLTRTLNPATPRTRRRSLQRSRAVKVMGLFPSPHAVTSKTTASPYLTKRPVRHHHSCVRTRLNFCCFDVSPSPSHQGSRGLSAHTKFEDIVIGRHADKIADLITTDLITTDMITTDMITTLIEAV